MVFKSVVCLIQAAGALHEMFGVEISQRISTLKIIILNHSLALQKSYFLNPPHKPSGNVMLFYDSQLYINVTDVSF